MWPGSEVLCCQVPNQLRRDVGGALEVNKVVVSVERPVDVPLIELMGPPDGVAGADQLALEVESREIGAMLGEGVV